MTRSWTSSKYPGIRYRAHETRTHGSRKDRYYAIYYRLDGRRIEEGVGWESAGWTEAKTNALLAELKENQRTGRRPQTLREQAEMASLARQEAEAQREKETAFQVTFAQFWAEFYAPSAPNTKKPETWLNEQGHYKNWIEPALGKCLLRDITPFQLERLSVDIRASKRSVKTQQSILATCRQVFNLAKRHQLIDVNPVATVALPKHDNRRQRHLSQQEAQQLLDLALQRDRRLHDICLLALHTGLRAGEIFKLRWEDVDLDGGMLLVRDPKSGKNRHAYLTRACLRMINDRFEKRERPHVFYKADGGPLQEISRDFSKLVDLLGWNDGQDDARLKVVFHTLRHTFASWLVQQGTPLYTVAKLMGHANLSMTERYSHLAPEGLRATMRAFDQSLPLI